MAHKKGHLNYKKPPKLDRKKGNPKPRTPPKLDRERGTPKDRTPPKLDRTTGETTETETADGIWKKGAAWAGKIAEAGTFGDLAAMSKGVPLGGAGNVVDKSDHITKVREGINYKQIAKSGETLDDWIKRTS